MICLPISSTLHQNSMEMNPDKKIAGHALVQKYDFYP